MKIFLVSLMMVLWFWILETISALILKKQRREWSDYILILAVAISACAAGKAYGEFNLRNPVITEETGYGFEEEWFPPQYREFYKVTSQEMEPTHDMSCKFVPPKIKPSWVNEDGTPSNEVVKQVRMCNQAMARASYKLHCEKSLEYFEAANEASIFLPNTQAGNVIKNLFVSLSASLTAGTPQQALVTAILTMITQYGVQCFETYEEIMFNLSMQKWHYNCAMLFKDYMKEKGW